MIVPKKQSVKSYNSIFATRLSLSRIGHIEFIDYKENYLLIKLYNPYSTFDALKLKIFFDTTTKVLRTNIIFNDDIAIFKNTNLDIIENLQVGDGVKINYAMENNYFKATTIEIDPLLQQS